MRASYLRFLLLACVIAPAVSGAGEVNPFIPSSLVTPEVEQRLMFLEQRAKEAERLLGELTMEQLPGVDAGLLSNAVNSSSAPVDAEIEVLGRINGKCLIKRGGSRLEEAPSGFDCTPGSHENNPLAN